MGQEKVTILDVQQAKEENRKLVMVTAYDYPIGLFEKFVPKFVKQYAQLRPIILDALAAFKKEVRQVTFPGPEHSFKMPEEALEQLKKMITG